MSGAAPEPATTPAPSPDALVYESTKSRAIGGAKVMALRYAFVALLSLAGSTLLIRTLGPERWATFSVAYYLVVFLDQTFAVNLLGQLVRSADPPGRREVDAAAWLMGAVGAGVLALLALVALPAAELYGRDELSYSLVAVGACGLVYALRSVSVALIERELDYRWIALADVADQLAFYAIALPLALLGFGLPGVAVALALRGVIPAVLVRLRRPTPFVGRRDMPKVRALLAFGVPSLGMAAVVLLNGLVPLFVLGGDNATELAFVLTSATMLGYAVTAVVVVQRVGFPSLAALQGDTARFRAGLERLLDVSNFVVVSAVVPLAALGPVWLPALFGPEWERAGFVMVVIGVGLITSTFATVITSALNALGHPRATFLLQLVITAAYLVLAFAFTEVSVLLGAAIGFSLSRTLGTVMAVMQLRRRGHAVPWVRSALAMAYGTAMMFLVAALLDDGRALAALAALAVGAAAWLAAMRREAASVLRAGRPARAAA